MKEIYPFPSSFSLVKSTCHFHAIYNNVSLKEHIDPFFLSPSFQTLTHISAKQLLHKIAATISTQTHRNIYVSSRCLNLSDATRSAISANNFANACAGPVREENILCLDSYKTATALRACSK